MQKNSYTLHSVCVDIVRCSIHSLNPQTLLLGAAIGLSLKLYTLEKMLETTPPQ